MVQWHMPTIPELQVKVEESQVGLDHSEKWFNNIALQANIIF